MSEQIKGPNALPPTPTAGAEQAPKKKEVLLEVDGVETLVTEAQFQEMFNVKGWVRIQPGEFDHIQMKDGQFGHFNYGKAGHVVGEVYSIIKIERSDPARVMPPLLSRKDAFRALCVRVDKVKYGSLSPAYFEYPVIGMHTSEDLPGVIKGRYPAAEGLTKEQFDGAELTYTLFRKVDEE